jgi:hypothetical protein
MPTQRSTKQAPRNQSIAWYRKTIENYGRSDTMTGFGTDYDLQSLQDILNEKLSRKGELDTKKVQDIDCIEALRKDCYEMIAKIRQAYNNDIKKAFEAGFNSGKRAGIQECINKINGVPF